MADNNIAQKKAELELALNETRIRIRRYTLDPRLKLAHREAADHDEQLRTMVDKAWTKWRQVRDAFCKLPASATLTELDAMEGAWLELDRQVDEIQRELISTQSLKAGRRTVLWLAVSLVGLTILYLLIHGIRGLDFTTFEPWPEWGPLKYGEVAFWSTFGVLCTLLSQATYYLTRRDFDLWYQPWYVSTALRAPFLTIMLMVVVLEFTEWQGESSKWVANYLLAEGNKYIFTAFVGFCLGLTSKATSKIMRDLAESVSSWVCRLVAKFIRRLNTMSVVTDTRKR